MGRPAAICKSNRGPRLAIPPATASARSGAGLLAAGPPRHPTENRRLDPCGQGELRQPASNPLLAHPIETHSSYQHSICAGPQVFRRRCAARHCWRGRISGFRLVFTKRAPTHDWHQSLEHHAEQSAKPQAPLVHREWRPQFQSGPGATPGVSRSGGPAGTELPASMGAADRADRALPTRALAASASSSFAAGAASRTHCTIEHAVGIGLNRLEPVIVPDAGPDHCSASMGAAPLLAEVFIAQGAGNDQGRVALPP